MSAAGYLINNKGEYNPLIDTEVEFILNDFDAPFNFHKSLAGYNSTPLIELTNLARLLGVGKILVKDEGQRFGTSALKVLGASYAIRQSMNNDPTIKGVCTATDGNHGRALAWSARQNGLKAVVFVPNNTSKSRIEYIINEGAEVIVSNGKYDDAVCEAEAYAKEKHYTLIQDTAWTKYIEIPATITAGYYTQLHETIEQTSALQSPRIDVIFVQAGVGSWPSAVVHFIRKKLKNNHIKIVCVEPFESDAIYESIKLNAIAATKKSQNTIMAGLNCGTPSILAYEILKQGVDAFLIISDQYAIDAIKYLNAPLPGDPYIASGESGSAGLGGLLAVLNNHLLDGLKKMLQIDASSNILLFNTENVTDPDFFNEVMGR